ncbi:bifunctional [glutamine synthetase] adenylyltransferase/[glutamine synthetase]-adenylyl-L-tyrosine phosphorylase [Rhodovulum sp. DZ06]|uniref:bifunctional [glutamine synthetase] adenylyltransferase/[glutamine synthetase]-adenylyl-L-tyrosine phosphorylase n=1 Tax=Rhodovulum sp. DZ06 TaxID=3425126 RepID=UPI003D349076
MTQTLAARLTRCPLPADPDRGAEAWARLSSDPALKDLVTGAAGSAPYIAGLIRAEAEWLSGALSGDPDAALADALAPVRAAKDMAKSEREAALRAAKKRIACLAALADLGGAWSLEQVTGALSDLADIATDSAMRAIVAEQVARGRLPQTPDGCAGMVALAMGKGGARELNYSSDIDLILLFDETLHDPDDYMEIRSRLVKAAQEMSRALSQLTAEGYVFRVDLRLRPDPSSTPVCIAMEAAERYYESLGRTWERAAFIKARAAAGDVAAGEAFLQRLTPFIWRKHLDFAAIGDAHDIRERIRAHRGTGGPITVPGHNMKLGRGGIREIEFFAQTRQLICGGRDPELRMRATRPALAALAAKGWVDPAVATELDAAYVEHREVEHRLQMVEDQQTHSMPKSAEALERVALLSGRRDRDAWMGEIHDRLTRVAARTETFFAPGGDGIPAEGQEPPAADAEALTARGFARGESAEKILERWRLGAIPATRSERARRILARLEPRLLDCFAAALSPDEALSQFDRFLSGLPAGVQLLSLLEANPRLLDLVTEIFAAAPRLAAHLGRSSRTLDALLERDFFEPLPDVDALAEELAARLAEEDDYERKLDASRRWAKEKMFRVGVQTLRGLSEAEEAGRAFTALAEASLRALMPVAEAELARRFGPAPGRGASVLAMGKMGSREMTATSDLDVIILYDPEDAEMSEGPKQLSITAWYTRFTQALISAMTVPTAEGAVWEVDTRLRPSGRQGTVATALEGFRAYQAEKAWTWERMALARGRAAAGRTDLREDVEEAAAEVLAETRDEDQLRRDVAEMRARVTEANKARRAEPWALKLAAGGLMDVEFVAQAGLLRLAARGGMTAGEMRARPRAPREMLALLVDRGAMDPADAAALSEAHALQLAIQQIGRIAMEGEPDPARIGPALAAVMARAAGAEDLSGVEARLRDVQARAADVVERLLSVDDLPAPQADAAGGAEGEAEA